SLTLRIADESLYFLYMGLNKGRVGILCEVQNMHLEHNHRSERIILSTRALFFNNTVFLISNDALLIIIISLGEQYNRWSISATATAAVTAVAVQATGL
ncbi:hypothetical protein ACJX0J_026666, partial [Zea mays]